MVDVVYNDEIPFSKIQTYNKVVLSPGHGLPKEAGDLMEFIQHYHSSIPILGICLGFQALVEFFGGSLINQKQVKHGVSETCFLRIIQLYLKTHLVNII